MKKYLVIAGLAFLLPCFSQAQDVDMSKMKVYQMVFLKKGPRRDQDSITAAQIQREHLAYLDKMALEGKLCLAGPFMDKGDIRGIAAYNVPTTEEAQHLAEQDPAVKAGRLVVEVHPWFTEKGRALPE